MSGSEPTWVARVIPAADRSVETLLGMPLGLDVWERHEDALLVAAPEDRLAELERRRLAHVERWCTTAQYQAGQHRRSGEPPDEGRRPGP